MTDHWMPVAETNPIPGDPWALQSLVGHLRGREAVIRDVLGDLRKIDSTGYWHSHAAEGFTEQRDKLLPNLELLAARYERTGKAMDRYSRALEEAQNRAEQARLRGKAAQEAIDRALRELDRKAAETAPLTMVAVAVPVLAPVDPDQAALEQAEGDLAIACQLLRDAEQLRDEAAGRCASAIDDAV